MRKGVAAVVGSVMLAGCSVFGVRSGTEQPAYEVVARLPGAVEVRRYTPRVAAEAVVAATDPEAGRNTAFGLLFDYISGANRGAAEIAMTAPVAVDQEPEKIAMTVPVETRATGAGEVAMRFFLPASYTLESAPVPTDPRIELLAVPARTEAVLRFSGSRSADAVQGRIAELTRTLEGSAWQATGTPVALFYDPPWTLPFFRRNEVAVPVEPRSAPSDATE